MDSVIPKPENSFSHAVTDLTGRFISVDDGFCTLLQRERRDILNQTILGLTDEEYRPLNTEKLNVLRKTRTTFSIRKTYILGNGGKQPVENVVSLLTDGSGQSVVAATVRPLLAAPYPKLVLAVQMASLILQERDARARTGLSRHEDDVALMLAAYILETEGASGWASALAEAAGGDARSNLFRIWALVGDGTFIVDGQPVNLEMASIRLSHASLIVIERYLTDLTER